MFDDISIDDFNNLGFSYTNLENSVPIRFQQFQYTNANNGGECVIDPKAAKLMRKLSKVFCDHIIKKYYKDVEILGYDMWQGVPPDLKFFHNDYYHQKKSHNSNIFVFIDECTGNNVNFLEVRAGLEEFYQVIPNKNDLVWLNQAEQFTYKMIHQTGKNRILQFRYYINGLDNQTN